MYSKRKTMQIDKYIRLRGTRQHLDDSILIPTGASHKHLHINPIKEKERSRNFPFARRPTARPPRASRASCLAPLVPRSSRASRFSSTCASQQRAPLSNVRLSARPLRRAPRQNVFLQAASALVRSHTDSSAFVLTRALLYTCASQHVFSQAASALVWSRTDSSAFFL